VAHALGGLPLAKELCRALWRIRRRTRDIGGERKSSHVVERRKERARGLEREGAFLVEAGLLEEGVKGRLGPADAPEQGSVIYHPPSTTSSAPLGKTCGT